MPKGRPKSQTIILKINAKTYASLEIATAKGKQLRVLATKLLEQAVQEQLTNEIVGFMEDALVKPEIEEFDDRTVHLPVNLNSSYGSMGYAGPGENQTS